MPRWKVASPGKTRVGWIGTGVMGRSMCGHLLDRGYQVTVFNRTRARAEPLLERGATWADAPADLAASSNVVFSMVGFPSDVRGVFLDERGVLAGIAHGSIAVDMTTSEPSLAIEIARLAGEAGCAAIDAPVSGGDVGAREARLSIMVGGDEGAVGSIRPLLDLMGRNIRHMGGPGAGQHTKLANQILIATTMIGLAESLLYGYRTGLDPAKLVEAIRQGAAGCWSLDNYAPRILKRDFEPGFVVEHFVKDMGIALAEASRLNLVLPGLALAHQLYERLVARGKGRLGTQALALVLEELSGCEIRAGG